MLTIILLTIIPIVGIASFYCGRYIRINIESVSGEKLCTIKGREAKNIIDFATKEFIINSLQKELHKNKNIT